MNRKSEIGSGAVLIVLAAIFYIFSFRIQFTTSDILGSRFFPQAAAILVILLSLIQIIQSLRSSKQSDTNKATDDSTQKKLNLPLILTVAALFVYYLLILQIGFTITSILYLLFESYVLMSKKELQNKKLVTIVIITDILFPIFLNTVFYSIFHIKLPAGMLFK